MTQEWEGVTHTSTGPEIGTWQRTKDANANPLDHRQVARESVPKLASAGYRMTPILHLTRQTPACVLMLGTGQLLADLPARHPSVLGVRLDQRNDGLVRQCSAQQLAHAVDGTKVTFRAENCVQSQAQRE